MAAAAQRAGTDALIYLPAGVSHLRVERIKAVGGRIVCVRGTYDDAVNAAAAAAARGNGLLLPDTSGDPNDTMVRNVMAGYGLIAQELRTQFGSECDSGPTHVFIQAGVGGLAAAMAEGLHAVMRGPRRVLVVEPESAACVARALEAGRAVRVAGSLETSAEMLSCGIASAPALRVLQHYRAHAIAVPEHDLRCAPRELREAGGPETTPSGSTGLAGLLHVAARPYLRAQCQLHSESSVLLLATEGPLARMRRAEL